MIVRDDNKHDELTIMWRLTNDCNVNCDYCFLCSHGTGTRMDDGLVDQTIEYIKTQNKVNLIISGGDPGLLDPKWVLDIVHRVRPYVQEIQFQTALLYKITDAHLELFKACDLIMVSVDGLRLNTTNRGLLFEHNMQLLADNNIQLGMLWLLTKSLITKCSPQFMFNYCRQHKVVTFDFWTLYKNHHMPEETFHKLRAINREVNEWIYKAYLEWEKIKDCGIVCNVFDAMEQALVGNHYYCHSRHCNQYQQSINYDGSIACCDFRYNTLYGTVSNQDLTKKQIWITKEQELPFHCVNCPYLKYCKGGCYHLYHDGTDCGIPHKIFEYLITKYGL